MPRVAYTYYSNAGGPRLPGRPPNPLMRILGAVLSLATLAVAAFLGFFVFLAVIGFLAVAGLVLAIRVWWIKRKWERAEREARRRRKPDYIDVDYTEH